MQIEEKSRLGRLAENFNEYREWASLAQQQTGKRFFTQFCEIRALKQAGGRCGISDYYWYKLYDDDYMMGRGVQDFLGWRLQQNFSLALNPRNAVLPAWDKFSFITIAGSAGMPVAPVRACFHRAERISEMLGLHLKSKEAVGAFLRNSSIYPLFGKPSYSQQGYGSAYLAGYDSATDSLNLLNGSSMPVDNFLQRLDKAVDHRFHKPECGFLFQDSFKLAPEIQALTNWSAICGVRIICLNGADGVQPIRAIWKIAVPPNHLDNFSFGKYGNMLANIDLATGEVSRVIGGFWPKTEVLLKNPLTGRIFNGFRLPGWNKILEACQHGGTIFPLMKIQHWDFALTDQGPLILELNDIGGTEGMQVHGEGLLTEKTREFLKHHANTHAQPWVRSL